MLRGLRDAVPMRKSLMLFARCSLTVSTAGQSVPRQDGASETWQKLLKLRTTASVMHVTAHPDDEHGGVLAKLSRGDGARLALLTLNRGESGDNAIGPQLFDGLGSDPHRRTADRRSPLRRRRAVLHHRRRLRLLEAARGSARQMGPRDGAARRGAHHPHEPADDHPVAVPGQRARRARQSPDRRVDGGRGLPRGRRSEAVSRSRSRRACGRGSRRRSTSAACARTRTGRVRIDSGEYSPRLGDSYDNVARYGLSFQRSQNSGRFTPTAGPNSATTPAVDGRARRAAAEGGIDVFDGIPTTDRSDGRVPPAKPIDDAVAKAMAAFTMTDPSATRAGAGCRA